MVWVRAASVIRRLSNSSLTSCEVYFLMLRRVNKFFISLNFAYKFLIFSKFWLQKYK